MLRRRLVAGLGLLALLLLAGTVLPRALDGPGPVGGDARGPSLTVMTVNVLAGGGDATAVMRLARRRGVDVLSVQEVSAASLRRLDAAGARRRFPHRALDLRGAVGGSALLATRPLRARATPRGSRHGQPEGTLRIGRGLEVRVKAVHPVAPVPGQVPRWRRELRALPGAVPSELRVLAGDFNATLDHRELRRLLGRGYVDAADAVGAGLRTTWPAGRRLPPEVTIDHVLVDRRITVRELTVHTIPRSDHRAVVARLQLPAR